SKFVVPTKFCGIRSRTEPSAPRATAKRPPGSGAQGRGLPHQGGERGDSDELTIRSKKTGRRIEPAPGSFLLRRLLALLQEAAHAADRFGDVLEAVGVGDAQVAFAVGAEAGAGDRGDAHFVEQRHFELFRFEA